MESRPEPKSEAAIRNHLQSTRVGSTTLAGLSEAHSRALSEESGLSDDAILARGYRTETVKAELGRLGFADYQRSVPALVVPLWSVHGEVWGYQSRPDRARMKDGKPVKYETPTKQPMNLDVPPSVRPMLADPSIPLWITEGAKKADAMASRGYACVALLGVWNWRGTNDQGGKTALAAFDSVALNGREVTICYDSDVAEKDSVRKAMIRLGAYLKGKGAVVRFTSPPSGPRGEKRGLDDHLANGGTVDELVRRSEGRVEEPEAYQGRYFERDGKTFERLGGERGDKPLANFTARLLEVVLSSDGAESKRLYRLRGSLGERELPEVLVTAEKFRNWRFLMDLWPPGAMLEPGQTVAERMCQAVVLLSGDVPERKSYAHLGWVKDEDGRDVYLHTVGAIGPDGSVEGLKAEAGQWASKYALLEPPVGEELLACVRASMRTLDMAPERITGPLLGAVYRASMGLTPYTVWLEGTTQTRKTAMAACMASHFGADYHNARGLIPWDISPAAISSILFVLKDCLQLIDDSVPRGSTEEQRKHNGTVQKVLRWQGNYTGRWRANTSLELRPERPPRGLILSTGEQAPPGHSETIRVLVIGVEKGDARIGERGGLTLSQNDAREGLLAGALAGFLQWVARQGVDAVRPVVPAGLRTDVQGWELRESLSLFTRFAKESGVPREEVDPFLERAKAGITQAVEAMASYEAEEDPTDLFRRLLQSGFEGGRFHLTRDDGTWPGVRTGFGWIGVSTDFGTDWKPQGPKIGWFDREKSAVYLIPDAAYSEVCRLSHTMNRPFPVSARALWKHLKEKGLIRTSEPNKFTVKVRGLEGSMTTQTSVIHLLPKALGLEAGPKAMATGGQADEAGADPFMDEEPPALERVGAGAVLR